MYIEFIELPIFERLLTDYLSDEEYAELQWYLANSPDAGDLISSGGGIRKLRWNAKNKGKSGGVRIIYYHYIKKQQILFMTIYSKSEASDISKKTLKILRRELPK